MTRRGADLVVDALVAAGVQRLFTLSGNHVLALYDATIGRDVELIHTRHEAAAVHMADAWGRLTEHPGVVLVTAGPGHANALGALYTALMAESPVVLLSGHAPRSEVGLGGFQEMDQVAMARPVTKAAWLCDEPDRLGVDVRTALDLAAAGRPGPVHLSLPGDVLDWRVSSYASAMASARDEAPVAESRVIEEVLDGLAHARRPLVLVGPAMGRGPRWKLVEALATATGVPALAIESPRGVNDPWLRRASSCFGEADFVLLLGKALDFSLKFGSAPVFSERCRFVQVDPGAPAPAKTARIDLAIAADAPAITAELLAAARRRAWTRSAWADEVTSARTSTPSAWADLRRSASIPMHPLRVAAALEPHVAAGAVLVSDGGEFGQWMQAALDPRERLINGPGGSIGGGLPMALGAKLACPDRPVLVTLGDGTFGYHALEVDTAIRHGLPVVAVVGNDARWNAEHQLQLRQYGAQRAVGCDLRPSRYDRIAEALGGHGEFVERQEQLEPALDRAIRSGKPAVVNVLIEGAAAPLFR
jgi:acetolactate synthase-1/2/3 large subunit